MSEHGGRRAHSYATLDGGPLSARLESAGALRSGCQRVRHRVARGARGAREPATAGAARQAPHKGHAARRPAPGRGTRRDAAPRRGRARRRPVSPAPQLAHGAPRAGAQPGPAGGAGAAVLCRGRGRGHVPQHHRLPRLPALRPAHARGARRRRAPHVACRELGCDMARIWEFWETSLLVQLHRSQPVTPARGPAACVGRRSARVASGGPCLPQVLRRASEGVFVPLTVGGGIRGFTDGDGRRHSALDVAAEYFRSGADKARWAPRRAAGRPGPRAGGERTASPHTVPFCPLVLASLPSSAMLTGGAARSAPPRSVCFLRCRLAPAGCGGACSGLARARRQARAPAA